LEKLEFMLEKIYDPKEDSQEDVEETVEREGSQVIQTLDVDEKITHRFFNWLDSKPQKPFFAFLHFQGAHSPFVFPSHFTDRFIDEEELERGSQEVTKLLLGRDVQEEDFELLNALYDTRLRFSDQVLGQVLEGLRARELFTDSLIIIMGDHGSQIQRERKDAKATHGTKRDYYWESYKPHAFLLIRYPKQFEKSKQVTERVLSVDILPTLADFLEVKLPDSTDGKSFLKVLEQS